MDRGLLGLTSDRVRGFPGHFLFKAIAIRPRHSRQGRGVSRQRHPLNRSRSGRLESGAASPMQAETDDTRSRLYCLGPLRRFISQAAASSTKSVKNAVDREPPGSPRCPGAPAEGLAGVALVFCMGRARDQGSRVGAGGRRHPRAEITPPPTLRGKSPMSPSRRPCPQQGRGARGVSTLSSVRLSLDPFRPCLRGGASRARVWSSSRAEGVSPCALSGSSGRFQGLSRWFPIASSQAGPEGFRPNSGGRKEDGSC